MSMPIQPSGIASAGTTLCSASAANAVATIVSTGNSSETPFSLAVFINSAASSTLSASSTDVPMA